MSELKAYKPYANRDGDVLIYHKGDGDLMLDDEDEIYLKEDADKVIARHKYKRCLAMAKWCRESLRLMRTYEVTEDFWNLEPGQDAEYFCKKGDFYSKWHKRWLELAEKFKEAK